ncbi:MAG: hypothetical protein JRI87_05600 [Deltaproteobacteria bacterium]|nr:hypothetical protein [Deltaproteobacteria bacterium]
MSIYMYRCLHIDTCIKILYSLYHIYGIHPRASSGLQSCNYNYSQAAKILKISRSSLYNKIRKCNINPERH